MSSYEKELKKNIKRNDKFINEFRKWLEESKLSPKTIRKHVGNIDLYINDYLNYYEVTKMEDGVNKVYSFLSDWFINKCAFASKTSIKEYASSIKKFYKCMSDKKYIDVSEYNDLCKTISNNMDEFLSSLYEYDNYYSEYYDDCDDDEYDDYDDYDNDDDYDEDKYNDEILKMLFENRTVEEISNLLFSFNRYKLNKKDHIKKYNKLRKIHSEILNSMVDYILSSKYDIKKYDDMVCNELGQVKDDFDINFDLTNEDDATIILELFVYDNHPKIKSVTDIYLENNKFKNSEKIKFLKCMKNSYVGLFEVIDVDKDNGYVTYKDVFTNKVFKIIDIAMSGTLQIDKKVKLYTYNRIITFDDISFATGIHCNFSSKSKLLKKFIDTHDYNNCSSFIRCLLLYDIYKKDSDIISNYNHKY